ncbi:hypothetical protein DB347_02785 [Opitutaceae bacterium EW11]|nr:hypothetical protein DB347_02785 [Opitutaceae bacterium EW11]
MSESSPARLDESEAKTPPVRDNRFPPGVPYIVGNEAAERFSFYGMRQILYIYVAALFSGFVADGQISPEAKVHATQVTHLFNAGVYLFPLIGAILADRLLGKYAVIFWVSLVYVAGQTALAFGGHAAALGNLDFAKMALYGGLLLIAIGSGGIKPCVSANVGDQFTSKNAHLVPRIFQIFYFTVNFGSFFASVLTPWLYKQFSAAVAFAVPGALMLLAALVFWMGRNRFIRVPPKPGGALGRLDFFASSLMTAPLLIGIYVAMEESEPVVNAATQSGLQALIPALGHVVSDYWLAGVAAVVLFALGVVIAQIRQRREADSGFLAVLIHSFVHRKERRPGEDFWAPARRRFGEEAAEGPPAVLRIIVVFSMVSVFWALFDQHSSTWVEQAKAMNRTLHMPTWAWDYWAFPAILLASVFAAFWLFFWVSNRRIPRAVILGLSGLIVAWGIVCVALQFTRGGTTTLELLPAQIAALNPLLVMFIIPALNFGVYEPLERRGRPLKPLVRMTIGMATAGLAFVAVAIIQAKIEASAPGSVHVLWQLIPYTIITTAEVLISVTGLEFAYTQAPRAMKSTIMGFWLLCVTFGNVLVAFLAPLQTLSLATFFWTFAGLMAAATVLFAILASMYKGKSYLQA